MELAAMAAMSAGTNAALATAGGVATAAQVGATTGGMLASALGSGSILSMLGTGLSLASMAGDIFGGASAGRAEAEKLRQQAEQDFLNAKQEELAGKQEANDINENLIQTISEQRLAYSGAGIDFSFGTPASLERSMTQRAEMQLGTSRDNARLKTLARKRAGYTSLSRVAQEQSKPLYDGIGSAVKTGMGMFK